MLNRPHIIKPRPKLIQQITITNLRPNNNSFFNRLFNSHNLSNQPQKNYLINHLLRHINPEFFPRSNSAHRTISKQPMSLINMTLIDLFAQPNFRDSLRQPNYSLKLPHRNRNMILPTFFRFQTLLPIQSNPKIYLSLTYKFLIFSAALLFNLGETFAFAYAIYFLRKFVSISP